MSSEQRIPLSHRILLLCDRWDSTAGGIANVNMTLALHLARYRGIEIYSTIFGRLEDLTPYDRQLAERHKIRLISLAKCVDEDGENGDEVEVGYRRSRTDELYVSLNENPKAIMSGLKSKARTVSHIIGHAPITAAAAVRLRQSLYEASKVVLFYHVISTELEWLRLALPYVVPTDTEMVRLGENADVVFSVTEKIRTFYNSKFCNRSDKNIDHRLYLPQCTAEVFNVQRSLDSSQLPKQLEGTLFYDSKRSDVGALGDVGASAVCSQIIDTGKPYGDHAYAIDVSRCRLDQPDITDNKFQDTVGGRRERRRQFRSEPKMERGSVRIIGEYAQYTRDTHSAVDFTDKYREEESRRVAGHTDRPKDSIQDTYDMRYGQASDSDDMRHVSYSERDDMRYEPGSEMDARSYGPESERYDGRYGPESERYDRHYVPDSERDGARHEPGAEMDDRRYEPGSEMNARHYGPESERYGGRYGPGSERDDGRYGPGAERDGGRYEPGAEMEGGRYEPGAEMHDRRYGPDAERDGGRYGPGAEIDSGRYEPGAEMDGGRYGPDSERDGGRYGPDSDRDGGRYGPDSKREGGRYGPDTERDRGRYGPDSKRDGRRYGPDSERDGGLYGTDSERDGGRYGTDSERDDGRYGKADSERDGGLYGPDSERDGGRYGSDSERNRGRYGPGAEMDSVSTAAQKMESGMSEKGFAGKSTEDGVFGESERDEEGIYSASRVLSASRLAKDATEDNMQAVPASNGDAIKESESDIKYKAISGETSDQPGTVTADQPSTFDGHDDLLKREDIGADGTQQVESSNLQQEVSKSSALKKISSESEQDDLRDTSEGEQSDFDKASTMKKGRPSIGDVEKASGRVRHVSGGLQTGFQYQVKEGETNTVTSVVEGTMQSEFTYQMTEDNAEIQNVTGNIAAGVAYVIKDPITNEVVGSVEDKTRVTLGDKPESGTWGNADDDNIGKQIEIGIENGMKFAATENVIINTNQSSNLHKSIMLNPINITNNNNINANMSNGNGARMDEPDELGSKGNLEANDNETSPPDNADANDTANMDTNDAANVDINGTANIDTDGTTNIAANDAYTNGTPDIDGSEAANVDNNDTANLDNEDTTDAAATAIFIDGGEVVNEYEGVHVDTSAVQEGEENDAAEGDAGEGDVVENQETDPPKELIPLMRVLVVCQRAAGEVGWTDSNEDWHGIDVATIAVIKAAQAIPAGFKHILAVGGVTARNAPATRERLENLLNGHDNIDLIVHDYDCPDDVLNDMMNYSICLVPSRCEAYGHAGLVAISSGIPTLIAEESCLAPLIRRLTFEPEQFLVPVTPKTSAVRQDASTWRDRILQLLDDPNSAMERACLLRNAIRMDEETRETHDDFIWYCLGGIRLRHHAVKLEFADEDDEDRTFSIIRLFDKFLLDTLKHCWRQKHHPLWRTEDRSSALVESALSVHGLIESVIDSVEMKDRRIVSVDRETGSFVVYCPTLDALTDLWAMCDVINRKLEERLLLQENSALILEEFNLSTAVIGTSISGPEYLTYKEQQLDKLLVIENTRT